MRAHNVGIYKNEFIMFYDFIRTIIVIIIAFAFSML